VYVHIGNQRGYIVAVAHQHELTEITWCYTNYATQLGMFGAVAAFYL
jgi:hypothetical protein